MVRLANPLAGLSLAALSALLLFVASEPLAVGVLGWVALVPLFIAILQARRPGWAAAYGLTFGLVFFGIHLLWIFLFGWMAWSALTLTMAAYITAGTFVAGLVRRHSYAPLLFAGAWAGAELLRDRWPYGGYPWGALGTTQGSVPGVRWLAGVVGAYGLSFLLAFAAALIAERIVHGRLAWRPVAVVAGVLCVFVAIDVIAFGSPPDGRVVRVAVVQGNVPRPPVPGQFDVVFANHVEETKQLLARERDVDVVVWPESAMAGVVTPGQRRVFIDLVRRFDVPFLIGRSFTEDAAYRNLQQYYDRTGALVDEYAKRHPVPFGEYVPIGFLRDVVGTLSSQVPVDQVRGTEATVFDVDGTKVATPICFESVFPRDFLDFARQGAEFYILSTNNASFEHSYAAQQHIAHARMRALETRQWVLQAALSGISAEITPDGRIEHATQLFTADGFVADVRARGASSLYAKTGDLFPMLFAVLTALVALAGRRRRVDSDA